MSWFTCCLGSTSSTSTSTRLLHETEQRIKAAQNTDQVKDYAQDFINRSQGHKALNKERAHIQEILDIRRDATFAGDGPTTTRRGNIYYLNDEKSFYLQALKCKA